MKEIKLTNSDKVALVDDEDYELVNKHKWHIHTGGYAACNVYINKHHKVYMHRMILGLTDPKVFTDHTNHNKLDNQRKNLRICNKSENMKNITPSGRSRYLGVSFMKRNKGRREYICAQIKANGKHLYLGLFPTEELAAKAYDEAAKIHHGEFANLNFKEELCTV